MGALGEATSQRASFIAPSRAVLLATVLTVATARCASGALQSSSSSPNLGDGGDSGAQLSATDDRDSSAAVDADGQADTAGQPDATAAADAQTRAPNDAGSAEAAVPAMDSDAALDAVVAEAASSPNVVTCTGATLPAGDTTGSVQVGGTMRTYVLHVPSSVTATTPVPLVVEFHGLGGTGSMEQSISGYPAVADQEGFVMAFPDGIDNAWNIGPCCTTSRSVDDLGFARALVTQIEAQGCIDPKRVYAVGYSMGGGMSHYLACNAADVFASIAPAAFDLLIDSEEPCNPSRPITEITFRGTADPIVPYDGGASTPPNGLNVTIHFLGAVGTFQKWSQLDGCTGSPSAADSNGCSTYSQCQGGQEVTLCTKQGGSHDPGDPQIAWPMLKSHPMP